MLPAFDDHGQTQFQPLSDFLNQHHAYIVKTESQALCMHHVVLKGSNKVYIFTKLCSAAKKRNWKTKM